jgi:hypothetical protein
MSASADTITEFSERLGQHMRELCEPRELKDNGLFYPHDYFEKLREGGQQPRLNWLRDRDAFFTGWAPTKQWELVELLPDVTMGHSNKFQYFFVLRQGVRPCDALDSLKGGPALLDCIGATQVALFSALRDSLGDEKFNRVFRRGGPAPLALDRFETPYSTSFWLEKGCDSGQVRQFVSHPHYPIRHPGGAAGGYTSVSLGDDNRYIAFGLGECTEADVLDRLAEAHIRKGGDWVRMPEEEFPYLTPSNARELRVSLMKGIMAGEGKQFLEGVRDRRVGAHFLHQWVEGVITDELSGSGKDFEQYNGGDGQYVRVNKDCLRRLMEVSTDEVDSVAEEFRRARPDVYVDYTTSPPRVAHAAAAAAARGRDRRRSKR